VRLLADGKLDTSFDNDGIVQIAFAADTDEADDIAIQADGKIVIVGPVLVGSTLDFMIARLNKDGSRDNSFGTAGLVTTGFGTLQDFARAVAIQPDGLIVAAGDASSTTASRLRHRAPAQRRHVRFELRRRWQPRRRLLRQLRMDAAAARPAVGLAKIVWPPARPPPPPDPTQAPHANGTTTGVEAGAVRFPDRAPCYAD
jgi:uncharacterized delta-60 repeat protein